MMGDFFFLGGMGDGENCSQPPPPKKKRGGEEEKNKQKRKKNKTKTKKHLFFQLDIFEIYYRPTSFV